MIKFGTGGWRAIIGDEFIKSNIVKVAQAFCDLMEEEGKKELPVMVGYDRRFLSETSAKWIAEVFAGNGVKTLFMKRSTPTPMVMFTVKNRKLHYGVEVTASHNPYDYNGIKFFVEEGRDAPIEVTNHIEQLIEKAVVKSMDFSQAVKEGIVIYEKAPFNDFVDSILNRLDVETIKKADLRILFDSMHGSATHPMLTMLHTARCTVDMMNDNKDGFFGGKVPAPTYELSAELRQRVVSEKYDLGIQVDGDGDRLAVIDSEGNYIEANQIMVMLYYYLHQYRGWKGPVVRNLATTHMLDVVAKDLGEVCYEVPVGFKHISSKLDEKDAIIGGESSGGMTVRGHIFGKDSIYATGLFVEMTCGIGKPLSEYWQELQDKYGKFVMKEDNLRFSIEQKAQIEKVLVQDKIIPDFDGMKVSHVGYKDGVKFYFEDNSFVICRFSGTEPLLRIFAESSSAERALKLIDCVKKAIF